MANEATMSDLKCQLSDCDQPATMHFVRAEGRAKVQGAHFCDSHGRSHIEEEHDRYYSPARTGIGTTLSIGNNVAFDIDFLFWDELQDPPNGRHYVQLIEVGGRRRVGFVIGYCECFALDFELQRYPSPRPLTHRTMAESITALGGRMQWVEIDRFCAARSTYEAKLHIKQMNATVVVDARPSDALVLALICDVPIVVSNAVLAAVADT